MRRIHEYFETLAAWADRHSPQTLFARALIIIVVPMLLLQALSAWWFYSQRGDNVTNRLAILLVRDLRRLGALELSQLLEEVPPTLRPRVNRWLRCYRVTTRLH